MFSTWRSLIGFPDHLSRGERHGPRDEVTRTGRAESAYPTTWSLAPTTLSNLQVEADSLAIYQHGARVEKLLSGAIELLVAAESGKR
jgi:hypothetical protein